MAEHDTVGDTVIVRTLSGSVWGEPLEMVEDVTIGMLEGPDELVFGRIQEVTVDALGGVYAFDSQVPALRYYDAGGNYVRTLGRGGSGPGEYGESCGGLAVRRDGKILLHDEGHSRVNVYEPDGAHVAHWFVPGGYMASGMTLDTAGHLYFRIPVGERDPNRVSRFGFLHLDPEGQIVDTVPSPSIADEPTVRPLGAPFNPLKVQTWSPLGYLLVGVNREYSFDVRPPGGPVVRIEREYEPVRMWPEERAEWEALIDYYKRIQPAFDQPVPEHKLPYDRFLVAEEGRIWVRRPWVAVKTDVEQPPPGSNRPPRLSWQESFVFDVFEPDGTYLGQVHFPPRTYPIYVRGDSAWSRRLGDLDEYYLVKHVISPSRHDATESPAAR